MLLIVLLLIALIFFGGLVWLIAFIITVKIIYDKVWKAKNKNLPEVKE